MAYSGKYRVRNPAKYKGDPTKVHYRSLWERQVFRWLDDNSAVEKWSSETVVIPYKYKVDNRVHRYFMDLYVEFKNRDKPVIIEIKPDREKHLPKLPKSGRKTKRYITECLTYQKNQDKWEAADLYAKHKGWEFFIWTEHDITALGIKLLK